MFVRALVHAIKQLLCISACLHTSYVSSTVKSFVEMTKVLLSQPDSPGLFLLSERISQDPLENYFGMQRSRGQRSGNPNIVESLQNAVAIRAQKSLELDRVRGNCRRKRLLDNPEFEVRKEDEVPMPKRKRT